MLHCNFKLTLHRIELRVYAAYERIRLFCAGWPLSHWIYCLSFNIHQQAQYITVLSELEPQIWEALLSQWHRIKQLSTMFSTKCKVLARHKNVFGKQNFDILAGIVHGECEQFARSRAHLCGYSSWATAAGETSKHKLGQTDTSPRFNACVAIDLQ